MVASEPFPRAGVAVVGGECADGQGDGVAERSGMWGGTPNRPATGPEHPVAGPGRWGTEHPAANRWDRTASSSPTAPTPSTGGTPWTGTPPYADLHGAAPWALAAAPGPQASGLRLAPEPVERRHDGPPTSPIPVVPALRALDPYPTGGYHAASVDPAGSGGFRGVDPHASGGFRVQPEPSTSPRGRAVCVERVPLAGRRAVRIRWSPGGVRRPAHVGRRASCPDGSLGRVASDARQRRVGRSLRPGLVRPARGPAVADGDDGRVVPGGLLDAAPAGDRHRPPPPPPGSRRLVTTSPPHLRARVGTFAGASGHVCCASGDICWRHRPAPPRPAPAVADGAHLCSRSPTLGCLHSPIGL